MEYRVINQNTLWDKPNIKQTKVGLFDVTDAVEHGIQTGIATGFMEEYFSHGLIFKDFYVYLKNFKPRFTMGDGKEYAFNRFMLNNGLLEKRMVRYHLTQKAHYVLKDLNSPNRI